MEAIKKILNPGKQREDEVLYGTGQDPLLAGTAPPTTEGQGSQVGGSHVAGNDPPYSATNPASSTEYGTGKSQPLGAGGLSGSTAGDDQYRSSSRRDVPDEASTTASILSGVPGKDQSSSLTHPSATSDTLDTNKPLPLEPTDTGFTGPSARSSAGPHTSTLANKADPRVDSDRDGSRGIGSDNYDQGTGSGLTGNALPDRTVGSSGYGSDPQPTDSTLGRDAALGAGAGAGVGAGAAAVLHHKRDQNDLRSDAQRSFPLAGHSDQSGHGLTGATGSTSAGPHSSSLANKVDPRVDSDLDGSKTAGNAGYGSGPGPHSSSLANKADPRVDSDLDGSKTAGNAGYGSGPGPHSSSLANKVDPRVDSDLDGSKTAGNVGYGSGTGPVAGAGSQGVLGRGSQSDYGRDTGILPTSQTSAVGSGAESWKHEHVSHGHEFAGDPCLHNAADGSPLFTKGPHATDTANLLDPHVTPNITLPSASTATSSDRELGSITQSGDSYRHGVPELGSTTHGDDRHSQEIPKLGSTTHGGDRHGQEIPKLGSTTHGGDRHGQEVPQFGSTTHGGDRHGPEVPELGSTTHGGDRHGRETAGSEPIRQGHDHHGRDAALAGGLGAGGLGAAGAAAYSSGHDDTPSAENTSTATGPHRSKLLNKLDPRVHAGSASSEDPASTAETSALIGSSKPGSSSHMPTSEKVGGGHDHVRDAGIAGAVGTVGVAGYEARNHPRDYEPTPATTSTAAVGSSDTPATTTREDYGHDPRSTATGGVGSHETESDPHKEKGRGLTSHLPGFLGSHHDKSREPTNLGHDDTTASTATKDLTRTGPESGSDHHPIRDAGLASAGIGGGLAAYETQKIHDRDAPVTTTEPSRYPPAGHRDGSRVADTYAGRDPTSVGGIGAGSGTADEAEFSKREAEKLAEAREKEFQKEQQAIHKEHVKHEKALEKEEKKHEKEEKKHEKEEKAHEKEVKKHEKEEKRHEKEEKKHEKELAKEEKKNHQDDGKKHGGILGLFRRDKTDSQDESDVRDPYPAGSYQGTEPATGVGAGVEHEKLKHEPNKLHKDPPAGYYESKGFAPPTAGDESQVAGGAGTTAPGQGSDYSTGAYPTGTSDYTDPNVSGKFADSNAPASQRLVTDRQTGLPVDLSKGTGEGGTDSGTMPGYHSHPHGADASGLGTSGTSGGI